MRKVLLETRLFSGVPPTPASACHQGVLVSALFCHCFSYLFYCKFRFLLSYLTYIVGPQEAVLKYIYILILLSVDLKKIFLKFIPLCPYCMACMLIRFSHVPLFATLWTVACQAPLSMAFSRQEHWSGLPFPSSLLWLKERVLPSGAVKWGPNSCPWYQAVTHRETVSHGPSFSLRASHPHLSRSLTPPPSSPSCPP